MIKWNVVAANAYWRIEYIQLIYVIIWSKVEVWTLCLLFWFPRLLKFRTSFRIKSISDITEECAPVLQLRLCDMWQWNVTISVRVTDCHGGVTIVVIRWLWCLDNNLLLSHSTMHTTTNTVQQFIISHSYLTFVFNLYILFLHVQNIVTTSSRCLSGNCKNSNFDAISLFYFLFSFLPVVWLGWYQTIFYSPRIITKIPSSNKNKDWLPNIVEEVNLEAATSTDLLDSLMNGSSG